MLILPQKFWEWTGSIIHTDMIGLMQCDLRYDICVNCLTVRCWIQSSSRGVVRHLPSTETPSRPGPCHGRQSVSNSRNDLSPWACGP